MRLPWRREARQINSGPVSTKALELDAAKQILAEVFHIRSADVEQMLQTRLDERSHSQEYQDDLWPAEFCLGGE
jgi:hypothetical protein